MGHQALNPARGVRNPTLLLGIGFALLVACGITRRLGPVAAAMEAVATGDLTRTVPAHGRDEIGDMARSVSKATGVVRETVTAPAEGAAMLARSPGGLSQVTGGVVASAQEVSGSARSANGSADEVSRNLQRLVSRFSHR